MLDKTALSVRLYDLARAAAPGLPGDLREARASNLRGAGLTSVAAVRLMLEIEQACDIAIPDSDLTPENFANLMSIEALVLRLKAPSPV